LIGEIWVKYLLTEKFHLISLFSITRGCSSAGRAHDWQS
jgi:hypothetical protein